ncbi:activating signal cointegrator 1 complex subunit 3 isoform X1 [Maylandia zebra]|uniref:Activating signal cointegrator 1 complex subunit 3 n=1 Tax=Astatotilapia calliptera TaxID=8154 RepID=A0AAX7T587_ASTCA|nr:activating signal cointegrator 1 complex subunit 3 [Maylandia zebra]XP_026040959.1 activating signal cointegrator 1 complex subunit 3 isoform X1 [Astatotilapia calliptera]XP_026040960.1 activating signal cointegrator 1 complex subunit 3 isoform X1 [Astatotilapia calliptera]XP_026040961.1 activating signal cointegrator 1 complex subunit 3 isoform X1 [Astatotilapia calliptera]XP_026040962.1 activating signal cointegrator 1 complex subunit 3 isoform X1 [Astatotilapia calliptera]XP_026040963.1 
MSPPRLTGALRSFSSVSKKEDFSEQLYDLKAKRLKRQELFAREGLTWQKIVHFCTEHQDKSQQQAASQELKSLLLAAKQMVASELGQAVGESAAVFLFETFHNKDHVGTEETRAIKHMFGPFPSSAAEASCASVGRLVALLGDSRVEDFIQSQRSCRNLDRSAAFGRNIAFSHDGYTLDPLEGLPFSGIQEESASLDFINFFNNQKSGKKGISEEAPSSTGSPLTPGDGSILRTEVDKYLCGGNMMSSNPEELCTSLFEMLASHRSNDELQNELFELLGPEGLDMISTLLQRRAAIVDSLLRIQPDRTVYPSDLSLKVSAEVTKPTYGCQVTIQSEQEKQMLKMYRREEKKERKRFKGGDEGDSTDALLTFDPREMRAQREQALLTARHEPVLSRDRVYERIRYPNVYDNLAEATKTAAFVGGARMLLPEGIRRENCKMYEEVEIPPNEPMPVGFEEKPVYISEIDEIGQLVFKGMKRLNRIQSIVFETAYNTNENLLICAPTGAGKTNIAMLTVLHEIRQHLQPGGVIKKDEFKIVYVAPMKALAAEMTNYFGKRLEPLGITVKELTGDMQLTKGEILRTQMLVTTPEKWDVVTRKSVGDVALSQIVRLLILDEVHLLHEDRGPVLESLVARTIRQVESTQSMIRILGLSATLPNYLDVATFLHVNPYIGLFFFDGRFRPVPLGQTFVGIKTNNKIQQIHDMEEVCYDKVLEQVKAGHQVMVFVHARNATVRTAMGLIEMAKNRGEICFFQPDQGSDYGQCEKQIQRSRNKQMKEMFPEGFGIHHAGMLRSDRSLMESMFSRGHLKVLVCTATLAWGVNLPAHAVIIKGTQIYDAKRGAVVDLGILDVMQIFGRAGRPQFDKYGEGTIITTHDKLSHYLTLLTQQNAIESRFLDSLADNLNAEIALGTVTNVEEAVKWLSYTYLYVRMRANPLVYGINHKASQMDPALELYRKDLVVESGRKLDKARMIRFDERTGYFASTDLGRTASHFYIKYNTIETFNEHFNPQGTEADILSIVSKAEEFEQLKVREEEMEELEQMLCSYCQLPAAGGVENGYGKVNILLQTYIGRGEVDSFSLISDLSYVAQNAARIVRALFEIALRKRWPLMTRRLLTLCKVIDKRLWDSAHPLRQFPNLSPVVLNRLEEKKLTVDKLKEMRKDDIGHMLHHVNIGLTVKQCVHQIPSISMEATIQPITRTVLRVRLIVTPDFRWNDQVHGSVGEPWWLWVEDAMNDHIYHSEYFLLQKKQVVSGEPQHIVFTIPIFEPLPSQYYIRAVSDRWLGAEAVCIINFQDLILPERHPPHTELLDLQPLPVTALGNREYESLYKFTHFNPIQTQIFHTLYHTDTNVLLGAPTGSGKTIAAEMAMFRVFNKYPSSKVVYIAPLKALVRERIEDWKVRIEEKLGKNVVELTGDVTPDMRAIAKADLIVTTPEKWDGVSRSWQNRSYVQKVAILIIDEIHLLGEDRGPVLEVIVSRTNFISSHTSKSVRVVGLSTALANARDLADWLGIGQVGLFNFRPSVRPVPLEVHIHGFPGQHYCPRMASMNKPTFQAIRAHSPAKPVLIFVSSRRQTRLTALDLIAYLATEDNPKQWLHQDEREIEDIIGTVRDSNLKLTLAFGIGMHHAGLHERDRKTVEELFVNCKIQVLIATSTLAWGVNFPAHLVVVKGTEYYDGKSRRYVDYPITDVLQMMGRAGRPQFDDQGKAVILVHDIKKDFYKKFLYEPFPVESSLLGVLSDHLNAEIAAGTISSKQDAMDYITWTYFFRRLMMNPSYYSLEDISHESINRYLSNLVERSLRDLEGSYCIEIKEDDQSTEPLTYGRIASYYYLKHQTIRTFKERLRAELPIHELLSVLTDAEEYAELPVRHNEDQLNSQLAQQLPLQVNPHSYDSAHTKTHLLLQAHFGHAQLPCSDYTTDTKTVLDNAIRICQAMLDVAANEGWLVTAISICNLVQMIVQGRWLHDSSLLTLPHVEQQHLGLFRNRGNRKGQGGLNEPIEGLPELIAACNGNESVFSAMVARQLHPSHTAQAWSFLSHLPVLEVEMSMKGWWEESQEQTERPIPAAGANLRKESSWLDVHADQEYVLQVSLRRLNLGQQRRRQDSKAQAPRFPKAKDEGWFLVLGEVDRRELLAVKRLGYVRNHTAVSMAFYTPERTGKCIYTLYLMSDSYLGLDQQYDVHLNVTPASIAAQVNSEVSHSDLSLG